MTGCRNSVLAVRVYCSFASWCKLEGIRLIAPICYSLLDGRSLR